MSSTPIRSPFLAKTVAALLGIMCLAEHAFAQQLEEVTVTARRREQRLEDVGISVTMLSGEQIRELRLRNVTDIATQTPSLAVAAPLGSSGNQNFTLRGVGLNDFSEHNESPVAAYQDGVYQATIAGINATLFDVDRVEVLRGPQGTLYGRNTTGGLVQFFSRQPTAAPEAFVDVDFGSHRQKRVEAAYGGPITDSLQIRVSGLYDYHTGWGETTTPGLKSANGSDGLGGRVLLKYLASEDTSVLLNVHASTNHTTGPAYTVLSSMWGPDGVTQIATPANVVNPTCAGVFGLTAAGQDCFGYRSTHGDPSRFDFDRQPFQNLDTHGSSVTLESKFGELSFTSITAYEQVHKLYGEDTDGGPFPAIAVTNPLESKQWTQELRLAGQAQRLYWTSGLYYFFRDIRTGSRTNLTGFGFVDDEFRDRLRSKSAAAFGQLEYSLTPQVTLIGGLRFSHEDQNFRLLSVDHSGLTPVILGITNDPVPDYNVFPFTGGTAADPTPYRDSRSDDSVTYRGELNWKPSADVLLYGSIAKGTKSAGWNGAIDGSPLLGPSTVENMPYAPEDLLAYEVGFKQVLRGVFRASATLFYYDYQDFQAFTFSGFVQQIGNRSATVKGAEVELVASPDDHLDITLGASALDSNVEGVTAAVAGSQPQQVVTRDREMVLAPKYTLNGIMRYHWDVGAGSELSVQLDSRYTAKQYFDLGNSPVATESGHAVSNASIGLRGAQWSGSLWVRNLTNREYRMYAIPISSLGFTQQMYGPQRWYGVTLGYKW
jgi:iron complex outermembrane recepter protein